jgi:hypothetical protein
VTLPANSSLVFSVTATITGEPGSVTNTATITVPAGSTDPTPGNNTASVDVTIKPSVYKNYMQAIYRAPDPNVIVNWAVDVGYEDLPVQNSDYDYNDWNMDINSAITYVSAANLKVQSMKFIFTPHSRGAEFNHRYQITFPANTFASNGSATFNLYDKDHKVIATQTISLAKSVASTFIIFSSTNDALPGKSNSIEGQPTIAPQRFADLTLTFDTPFAFTLNQNGLSQPHGEGLFFDSRLVVLNTGEEVANGDVRMLTVPTSDYLWPEESVRIDLAYSKVTYYGKGSLSFPASWWTTHNHCVYDGVACGVP